jgi:PAS domain S-box-containing protein
MREYRDGFGVPLQEYGCAERNLEIRAMKDKNRTQTQLLEELAELRRQIAQVEAVEIRQRVLSRVREEVWKMRSSEDIEHVLIALKSGLEEMDIPFQDCGVNIINASNPSKSHFHMLSSGGQIKAEVGIGVETILSIWREGKVAYRRFLEEEDVYQEHSRIGELFDHPVGCVIDIPFSHGTLAANSPEADAFSEQNIGDLQELADVLSEGFRRLDDIRQLEMRNRELEEEIAERKRAEERGENLNHMLRAIRNVNQIIVREKDRDRLLQEVCDQLIQGRGYSKSWIALWDETENLVTTVEAGLGESFSPMREQLSRGDLPDCLKRVLHGTGVVLIEDPLSECADCLLAGNDNGCRGMSIRLEHGGRLYGFLTILSPAQFGADGEELNLFQEVAGDIAFALHGLEVEEENRQGSIKQKASERNYREIFNSTNEAVFIHDIETGGILDVNQAMCDMWGYARDEALKLQVGDLSTGEAPFTQEDGERWIKKAIEEGPQQFSWRAKRKNGELFWAEVNLKRAVIGGENRILAVVRDITERRQAEDKLRKQYLYEEGIASCLQELMRGGENAITRSIEHLRSAADVSRVYIFDNFSDPEDGLCMRQIHETCAPGIMPQIDNPDLQAFPYKYGAARWQEMLGKGKPVSGEVKAFPKEEREILEPQGILSLLVLPIQVDGEWYGFIGFDDTLQARIWSEGDIQLLGTAADMIGSYIGRKRAQEVMDFERAQFLSIFDSIDEIVYVADPTTYEILYANKKVRDLLKKDLVGKICYREFQGLDAPCEFCTNEIILKEKYKPYYWDHHNPAVSRDYTLVDRIIKWPDGRDVRFELAIDITERKRTEEEIRRTQNLESLGLLAGGIAHDFNNVLTGVIGSLTLLEMTLSKESDEYGIASEARQAADKTRHLTRQLMTFSMGGSPVKEIASIEELVRETAELSLRGSNVKSEFHFAGDLLSADIDTGQIGQVVQNLVLNADQAMPTGGILTIAAENVEVAEDSSLPLESGSYVKVEIEDQGIGIPENLIGQIFDPYFTTKTEGHGLGLSIVYSIIKRHGGQISVRSEQGVGSTFEFYLPASEELADAEIEEEPRWVSGVGRILLMDDEEIIHRTIGRALKKLGYDVESAYDGNEALQAYNASLDEGQPYDVVIMDLTIPGGMGGEEAIVRFRQMDPQVRAIVSSGYSNDPVMAQYADYGFCGAIVKPIDLREMMDVVQQIIGD